MDAEIKAKWCEALRSGEYKQGLGMLKQRGNITGEIRHCCLGVLCEVLGPDFVEFVPDGEIQFAIKGTSMTGYLPRDIRTHTQLSYDEQDALVKMNDVTGRSFLEIADWIEENL